MSLNIFRPMDTGEPQLDERGRLTGISRYQDVLRRGWKRFLVTGFMTLLGFAPLALGIAYAILSKSVLVLVPAALVGGAVSGPFTAGLYDVILRALRDAPGSWWGNYRKAFAQNWRGALLPGAVSGLFLGAAAFTGMLLYAWAPTLPGTLTTVLYLFSWLLFLLVSTLYWAQLALFEQRNTLRLRNALLFALKYFWAVLGVTLLQLVWWLAFVLFAPLSLLLLPLVGVWFALYAALFLLYNKLDTALGIEQQLTAHHPEQAPLYNQTTAPED